MCRARVVKLALGLVGPKVKFCELSRGIFIRISAWRGSSRGGTQGATLR